MSSSISISHPLTSSSSCSSSTSASELIPMTSRETPADKILIKILLARKRECGKNFLTGQPEYQTKNYLFLIPLALFLPPRSLFPLTDPKEIAKAQLLPKQQLKRRIAKERQKKSGTDVVLVKPQKEHDRYEFDSKVMTRKRFMQLFTTTPEEAFGAHHTLQAIQLFGTNASLQTKGKHLFVSKRKPLPFASPTIVMAPKSEDISTSAILSLKEADQLMDSFYESLCHLINRYNSQISPVESMRTLWDMMSQAALERSSLSSSEIKALAPQLLAHWDNIHRSLWDLLDSLFAGQDEKIPEKQKNCLDAFESLLPLIEQSLQQSPETQHLIETLLEIQAPLHTLVRYITTHPGVELRLRTFINNHLHQMELHLKTTAQITPKQLQHLLLCRVKILQEYMRQAPSHMQEQMNSHCEHIVHSLITHQWMQTYIQINSLLDLINPLTQAAKLTTTHELVENVRIQTHHIDPSQRYLARSSHFAAALEKDFRYFILQGSASMIADDATELALSAFKGLNSLPSPVKQTPIIQEWLEQIKAFEKSQGIDKLPESFTMTLRTYQASLKKLDKIRAQLSIHEPLAAFIENSVNKENQHTTLEFLLSFQTIEEQIAPLMEEWHRALKEINAQISFLQNNYFLSLLNPSLPPIPLHHIQKKLKRLNNRLKEVVVPTARFIFAWNQLKTLSIAPRTSKKSKRLSPLETFPVAGFQTNTEVFKTFQSQLDELHAEKTLPHIFSASSSSSSGVSQNSRPLRPASKLPEVDDQNVSCVDTTPRPLSSLNLTEPELQGFLENNTSSSSSEEPPLPSARTKIQQAFESSTKKDKVLKQVYAILKSYGISALIRSAKGGHKMLMINGCGITLPSCKELKMGTASAIERQLIEAVQHAMSSSETSSSSSVT